MLLLLFLLLCIFVPMTLYAYSHVFGDEVQRMATVIQNTAQYFPIQV